MKPRIQKILSLWSRIDAQKHCSLFQSPKGAENPYGVRCLVKVLDRLGYKRVFLKSDQENPIKALVSKAKKQWSGEALVEHSPKVEFKANGEIEMIESHRASGHLPFRAWCAACVRGRGRSYYSHVK